MAGTGDESSRLVNLMRWVHAQVRHDGSSVNPEPWTALHLLEVCRAEKRGINCRMMSTILNEACLALGYPAHHITCLPLDEQDPDCHVITAAWAPSLGKWVYLDPTFEGTFRDDKGHLLSIEEVRNGLIQGRPLQPDKGLNWNGLTYDPGKYLDYMAKNLVKLSSPLESAYGYESRPVEAKRYVQLDPVTLSPKATGRYGRTTYLHDPSAFWAKP